MQICTKCNQPKPLSDFYICSGIRRPDCKSCFKKTVRKYQLSHIDQKRKSLSIWRSKHKKIYKLYPTLRYYKSAIILLGGLPNLPKINYGHYTINVLKKNIKLLKCQKHQLSIVTKINKQLTISNTINTIIKTIENHFNIKLNFNTINRKTTFYKYLTIYIIKQITNYSYVTIAKHLNISRLTIATAIKKINALNLKPPK